MQEHTLTRLQRSPGVGARCHYRFARRTRGWCTEPLERRWHRGSLKLPADRQAGTRRGQQQRSLVCEPAAKMSSNRPRRRREISGSLARVYRDVNSQRPREYWDYEALSVEWGYVSCVLCASFCRCGRWPRFSCLPGCTARCGSRSSTLHGWDAAVFAWVYPCPGNPAASNSSVRVRPKRPTRLTVLMVNDGRGWPP